MITDIVMNIAIDISPLKTGNYLQHRVRGTGFYLTHLRDSLLEYYPKNIYQFFSRGEKLLKSIDIIHYPYFEPFFLTLPLVKRYKTVVTVHDLTPFVFPKDFPSGKKGRIKWEIQRFNLRRSEGIIADSYASKKDIQKFCDIDENRIHVVYLAAGEQYKKIPRSEQEKIKKKYKLPDNFVLYVGDVTFNKNLPRLVKAVTKVNQPLVMVGKALGDADVDTGNVWMKDLRYTKELIKENPMITLLGFVPNEDLVALYNSATVFVMPSLYEGFGLPILEAMASGCPVITTKEGSLPEVAGDAAVYVDAYNVDAIGKGIVTVINDAALQEKLSAKGIMQSSKFSWEKTAKGTVSVYEKIIDRQ